MSLLYNLLEYLKNNIDNSHYINEITFKINFKINTQHKYSSDDIDYYMKYLKQVKVLKLGETPFIFYNINLERLNQEIRKFKLKSIIDY